MEQRQYIAIDLKSFYASVECVERGLDPLRVNLVVADASRTEKTICLAVSPSLKAYGIPGRARLFEVVEKVKEVNSLRKSKAPGRQFSGKTYFADELAKDASLELDYVIAPPRMAYYMKYSSEIYSIYLRYISPDDIHVYSIDEVFIDATAYLKTYKMTARELAMRMIHDVLEETGITATAGIGTNLYLCKIAMDIVAKHIPADADGVRIAELDEQSYREQLWEHRPLTDFWRVGRGYAKKLEANGMYTMGDVALCSVGTSPFFNEDLLYRLFGVNAQLLIDHAWGWEPCTMAEIKSYKPSTGSISSGQVLSCPYDAEKGKMIVREMTDLLVLDMVEKRMLTDQMVLTVGYDIDNLKDAQKRKNYKGEVMTDHYGRTVPKHAHGSVNLPFPTSSSKLIIDAVIELYDRIVDRSLTVRRMYVVAAGLSSEDQARYDDSDEQLDFFSDAEKQAEEKRRREESLKREKNMQRAVLSLKRRFGKNAVLKGTNLREGATAIERNAQIGGHRA